MVQQSTLVSFPLLIEKYYSLKLSSCTHPFECSELEACSTADARGNGHLVHVAPQRAWQRPRISPGGRGLRRVARQHARQRVQPRALYSTAGEQRARPPRLLELLDRRGRTIRPARMHPLHSTDHWKRAGFAFLINCYTYCIFGIGERTSSTLNAVELYWTFNGCNGGVHVLLEGLGHCYQSKSPCWNRSGGPHF